MLKSIYKVDVNMYACKICLPFPLYLSSPKIHNYFTLEKFHDT